MNYNQTHFVVLVKRFLINSLLVLFFGINLSTAHAQVCGAGQNLVAGQWTMIALPCAPTSNTVQDVFGDDLGDANYNVRWIVYERNEATDTYLPLTLSSTLNQGKSYWILSLDNASVGVTGTATPLTMGNMNCPSPAGCFEVNLTPPDINTATRQNMVGHPFPFDVDWADVVVEVDGVKYTPEEANTAGLVSNIIHKYNGGGYDPFNDVTPAMEGVLNIYDGIWVETLGLSAGTTVKLLIGNPDLPPTAQDDSYNFMANADQTIAAGAGLFVDNGSGADDLGSPAATLTSFGGGSLGGAVTDNAAGASVALAGGTLTVNADGSWSLSGQPFTPGTYTVDYQLTNSSGFSDATVTLNIAALASCTDDSYTATGNVEIDSTNGVNQSVLFNDSAVTSVTAFDAMSINSGNVNVLANGEFTYNPAPGYTGPDSFTYTADGSLICTVNLTVSNRIWFIDNSGVNGDGRLGTPFNSIANFNSTAIDATGDSIFIDSGGGNYAGPLTLLNNQKLIGEGATDTIANVSGITFASLSNTLPTTNGTRPTIASAGNTLTLASGNTVRGLDISNTAGTGLIGNTFGNLTLSEVSVDNTAGTAINLNTGNATASFTSVSSNNSTNGIILNNAGSGSFNITGTGSTAGSGGTIQNTSGSGISITSTDNISLSNLNLTNNAQTPTGTNQSVFGGNIAGYSAALDLSTVDNIVLTNMNINGGETGGVNDNNGEVGISGQNVSNFSATDVTVENFGNATNEDNVQFQGLTGTVGLTNFTSQDTGGGLFSVNNTTGSLTMTVDNGTFRETVNGVGRGGLEINVDGTGTTNVTVTNSTFGNGTAALVNGGLQGTGLSLDVGNSQVGTLTVEDSSFSGMNVGISGTLDQVAAGTNPTLTVNVRDGIDAGTVGNTVTNVRSTGINLFTNGNLLTGQGTLNATITGNVIGTSGVTGSGSLLGSGIRGGNEGGSTMNLRIDNNTIQEVQNFEGIIISDTVSAGVVNATITNNSFAEIDFDRPIQVAQLIAGGTTCSNISGNSFSGTIDGIPFGAGSRIIRVRQIAGTHNSVQTSGANIQAVNGGVGTVTVSGAINFNQPACTLP